MLPSVHKPFPIYGPPHKWPVFSCPCKTKCPTDAHSCSIDDICRSPMVKVRIPVRIVTSIDKNGQNDTPRSTQSQISTTTLSLTTIRPAAVRVLLKIMRARCAHFFPQRHRSGSALGTSYVFSHATPPGQGRSPCYVFAGKAPIPFNEARCSVCP